MARPIDADALIKRLAYCVKQGMGATIAYTFMHMLDEAPTIDAVSEWIPCSERLPDNGHYYLWCSDMGHVQSDYYWNGFEDGQRYGYNIVAWMPLPKPYGERKESE